MKKEFGKLSDGRQTYLYILKNGGLEAYISDFGATLQRLYAPDAAGKLEDVVLGFDTPEEYITKSTFFGAIIGRNSNRVKDGQFRLNGQAHQMGQNDGCNNLHSGPDFYKNRIWKVESASESSICLSLRSPDGDQGFPGNAEIKVTYTLEDQGALSISYDAICDQDTVFNMTNHTYFNLAGHDKPEKAMDMVLSMPARFFTPADSASIPTGEYRAVDGSPMDFRVPKPIGQDIGCDYDALNFQKGYDHNFEVPDGLCAILTDPVSGRSMTIMTDCPGVQFYSGNYLAGETGKDGVKYSYRSGICLETQYFPNAINQPEWKQPVTKAGTPYHSETRYIFTAASQG